MYKDIDIIVSTTLPTIDKLNTYKNGWDALLLYFRYIKQARLQKTNQTYSNDVFMMKAMLWWKSKFYKVKKILTDNNLIEQVMRTWEDGKILWQYVKVNFIINETTVHKNQTPEKPDSGKTDTNALSNKKENALNNKYKYWDKKYSKTEAIKFVCDNYSKHIHSDNKKYNKTAQAKLYIEQLFKEYDMVDLINSANNYIKDTSPTYVMGSQYFYSNSKHPNAKQYRVFEDWIQTEEPIKRVNLDFDKLI